MKKYTVGIGTVGPTDCTMFITDGKKKKEFGIESDAWHVLGATYDLKCDSDLKPVSFNENTDIGQILRTIMICDMEGEV